MLATLSLPEKERQAHAFAAAVALRMAHAGEDADRAATSVQEIQDLAQCNGWPFADAQVEYDSPLNQIMCDKCGWTNGMVCPSAQAAAATTTGVPAGGTTSS
ncbi:hypothetical protein [Micromonospora aurantiaca (nom. illeg.)]|uniref:hypothetical protein n=1 Tax=Micromonospora aurantiaca (nom. illeg.) TaxID=47850 RepID=UPI0008276F4D|nr:hypothetical protein [Micromonospora aurantiaca]SCL43686.1 hypothetical protein GA0070615_6727 [Micromonospora aurantiaca]